MSSHLLCAHADPRIGQHLASRLTELIGDAPISVHRYADAASLLAAAREFRDAGDPVPMVFAGLSIAGTRQGDLFRTLRQDPRFRGTRHFLLESAENGEAIDDLLQRGLMQARLDPEFSPVHLRQLLTSQLTEFVSTTAPHLIDELYPLLDLTSMADALAAARKNFELLSQRMGAVQRSVVGDSPLSEERVEDAMINEFDRVLGNPERRLYQPGEKLVSEGDEAGRIWIILLGRVKLIRSIEGEEVIFHSESAGRIVGLMSLSLQSPVAFTCRAITEVKAIMLTRDQVREAIEKSTVLAQHFITVIMRTMARRNARAAELLTEVRTLNNRLSRQRDELARTLDELRATQERLVDSAKMATLGNLAAGMAHELNNPVGALMRSVAHLEADLASLLQTAPELAGASELISFARQAPPISTREERHLRRGLSEKLSIDPDEAARLVNAGIRSPEDFERFSPGGNRKKHRDFIERFAFAGKIGVSLRTLANCSLRIGALVRSLKVYARDEPEFSPGVDLNHTLEDALLILANRIKRIELHKDYGDLPAIRANASQLQQIWTNLLSNALQAVEETGVIRIRTLQPRDGWVRAEIEDSGPGIPEEVGKKLWETRFTTRGGRVEFGLGLGLPIVRKIVAQHGGDITFESKPGRTVFIVELPVDPPATPPNENPHFPS